MSNDIAKARRVPFGCNRSGETSQLQLEDVGLELIEQGVRAEHQTMSPEKVFFSHCCTNLAPASWVLGALMPTVGLDFRWGLLALVAGNVLGAFPVALLATLGPRTRLTQIEISRFAFGKTGTRVPAALNWLCAVGWDAVNNVPSVLAIVALVARFGFTVPFWIGLAILAAIQLTASVCGHHVVQVIAKYTTYVLLVVFAITGIVAIARGGGFAPAQHPFSIASLMLGTAVIAGSTLGFAPYASDYSRYLPPRTKPLTIFILAFSGLTISALAIELCGLLTASRVPNLAPAAMIGSITALVGPFAPVALIAIAVSAVSINAINDNTAAYSLMSAGIGLPRHVAAIVTALLGYVLAVAGAGAFAMLFVQYMLLLVYWIAPWAGIVIAQWFVARRREVPRAGWASGATVFAIVTPLAIGLFSSTDVYTGPVAKLLGGTDLTFFVGFFGAGALYLGIERVRSAASHGAVAAEANAA
jgi:NCS1 family nucleobase:cation symporter-1